MWTVANIRDKSFAHYLAGTVPFLEHHVYVGRGGKGLPHSPLANPFTYHTTESRYSSVEKVDDPIARYGNWLRDHVFNQGDTDQRQEIARLSEIKHGILLCWCDPKPCHAHVIVEVIRDYTLRNQNQYPIQKIKGYEIGKFHKLARIPNDFWCIGNMQLLQQHRLIGCIGSRKTSEMGMKLFSRMVDIAIEREFTVVSGFAKGADIEATRRAVFHKKPSIVVLGAGFQHIYPAEHAKYVNDVLAAGGLLLSCHAPNIPLETRNLMQRNHFIINLASGVIVSEIGHHSGTGHAVRHALGIGRPCGILATTTSYEAPYLNTQTVAENRKAYGLYDRESVARFFHEVTQFDAYFTRSVNDYLRQLRQGDQATLF